MKKAKSKVRFLWVTCNESGSHHIFADRPELDEGYWASLRGCVGNHDHDNACVGAEDVAGRVVRPGTCVKLRVQAVEVWETMKSPLKVTKLGGGAR